jgi:hypothetical protein
VSGCLTTSKPVLDETNSRPVAEIPEFLAFVDSWERFSGTDGSPRELVAEGARGIVLDGMVVVQEGTGYFVLAMLGPRPATCAVYVDRDIERQASRFGVTVRTERADSDRIDAVDLPAPVVADGSKEALMAFIRDQFAHQRLVCVANPRKG